MTDAERLALAEAVRQACLQALLEAYEDAGFRGLCQEGRFDVAVDAVRQLDLPALCARLAGTGRPQP